MASPEQPGGGGRRGGGTPTRFDTSWDGAAEASPVGRIRAEVRHTPAAAGGAAAGGRVRRLSMDGALVGLGGGRPDMEAALREAARLDAQTGALAASGASASSFSLASEAVSDPPPSAPPSRSPSAAALLLPAAAAAGGRPPTLERLDEQPAAPGPATPSWPSERRQSVPELEAERERRRRQEEERAALEEREAREERRAARRRQEQEAEFRLREQFALKRQQLEAEHEERLRREAEARREQERDLERVLAREREREREDLERRREAARAAAEEEEKERRRAAARAQAEEERRRAVAAAAEAAARAQAEEERAERERRSADGEAERAHAKAVRSLARDAARDHTRSVSALGLGLQLGGIAASMGASPAAPDTPDTTFSSPAGMYRAGGGHRRGPSADSRFTAFSSASSAMPPPPQPQPQQQQPQHPDLATLRAPRTHAELSARVRELQTEVSVLRRDLRQENAAEGAVGGAGGGAASALSVAGPVRYARLLSRLKRKELELMLMQYHLLEHQTTDVTVDVPSGGGGGGLSPAAGQRSPGGGAWSAASSSAGSATSVPIQRRIQQLATADAGACTEVAVVADTEAWLVTSRRRVLQAVRTKQAELDAQVEDERRRRGVPNEREVRDLSALTPEELQLREHLILMDQVESMETRDREVGELRRQIQNAVAKMEGEEAARRSRSGLISHLQDDVGRLQHGIRHQDETLNLLQRHKEEVETDFRGANLYLTGEQPPQPVLAPPPQPQPQQPPPVRAEPVPVAAPAPRRATPQRARRPPSSVDLEAGGPRRASARRRVASDDDDSTSLSDSSDSSSSSDDDDDDDRLEAGAMVVSPRRAPSPEPALSPRARRKRKRARVHFLDPPVSRLLGAAASVLPLQSQRIAARHRIARTTFLTRLLMAVAVLFALAWALIFGAYTAGGYYLAASTTDCGDGDHIGCSSYSATMS